MCIYFMTFCAGCRQMPQCDTYIWVVLPVLVSFGSMAGVQYHILTSIVQTCFISPYFTSFAQHPVLKPTTVTDHHQKQMILTMWPSGISCHTCLGGGRGGTLLPSSGCSSAMKIQATGSSKMLVTIY